MSIIVGTTATWIAIIVFALIPKKLSTVDMIFLFCVDTIFELSMFSILHVNLKYIVVKQGVGNGIADLMFRLIELPLLLLTSSNLLLYSHKIIKWCGVLAIVLFTLLVQRILFQIKVVSFHQWSVLHSGIYIVGAIAFSRIMTWIITFLDSKEAV